MKVRTDFVTNSSSSSFVLAFTDEESIKTELANSFPEDALQYFETVYNDVKDADRLTKEQVIERIKKEFRWFIEYDLFKQARRNFGLTYEDWDVWEQLPSTKKKIDERTNSIIKSVEEQLDSNSVFVEVEYSDDENSELEHEIMPELPNTVIRFSYH